MKTYYAFKSFFKGPVLVGVVYIILFGGIISLRVLKPELFRNKNIPVCRDGAEMLRTTFLDQELSKSKIKLPIIMYHYVEYVADKRDKKRQLMNVNPDVFEAQVKDLQTHGYETVFMRDVPKLISTKGRQCGLYLALTFDDGYVDFYQYVYPILRKYNIKATVYIIVDYIGRPDFLTEAQIHEMVNSGLVEIGSHTLDHVYLKKTSYNVARSQIIDSKKRLERMFNTPIETFAYPFGAFDDQAVRLVKEASYSAAVTVQPGSYSSIGTLYILPRIRPEKFAVDSITTVLPRL
jgi:peptidoglycan/xylan/chitin deacetylase (PgdA/CDA1 family)